MSVKDRLERIRQGLINENENWTNSVKDHLETSHKTLERALENTRAIELLTETRNQIWKIGEITQSPIKYYSSAKEPKHLGEAYAYCALSAGWPIFIPEKDIFDSEGYPYTVSSQLFYQKVDRLVVHIQASGEIASATVYRDVGMFGDKYGEIDAIDMHANLELEELLAKDCLDRDLPYDKSSQMAEKIILDQIKKNGFIPKEDRYRYLLKKAKGKLI